MPSKMGRLMPREESLKPKGADREPWVISSRRSNIDTKCKKFVTEKRLNKWIDCPITFMSNPETQ